MYSNNQCTHGNHKEALQGKGERLELSSFVLITCLPILQVCLKSSISNDIDI